VTATSDASARRRRRPVSWGRWIGWCAVGLLFALSAALQSSIDRAASDRGFAARLLGPIARLAAGVEWVRADLALRAGDYPLAYERAETALELEPDRADAWIFFAHHLIFERASLARSIDPAERRTWVRAGLDVLARGIRSSSDPADILIYRGGVFAAFASVRDEDRPWPGSAREAWIEAADSFERAAAAGREEVLELAARARANAAPNANDVAPDRASPFRDTPHSR
jgi:hypothetical protein